MSLEETKLRTVTEFQDTLDKREMHYAAYPGLLGITNDPGDASVVGLEDWVWVRVGSDEKNPTKAFNAKVLPRNGSPVWVGFDAKQPSLFQVLDARQIHPDKDSSGGGLRPHYKQHTWGIEDGGDDIVPVRIRQIYDGSLVVLNPPSHIIRVNPINYEINGKAYVYEGNELVSVRDHIPTTLKYRWALIYLDGQDEAQSVVSDETDTFDFDDIPVAPVDACIKLGAVLLYKNMPAVTDWPDVQCIFDLRFASAGASTVNAFLQLRDTPATYATYARKILGVNDAEDALIYEDEPVTWRGTWDIVSTYVKNDMVYDDSWTMIANKDTTDRAAPQPIGDAIWLLPDAPSWTIPSITTTSIQTGQRYTFGIDAYLSGYRVWVPDISSDMKYRVILTDITVPASPITEILLEFNGNDIPAVGWHTVLITPIIVTSSSEFELKLYAANTSTDTSFTGDWDYTKPQNPGIPAVGTIVHSIKEPETFAISTTDDAAADRYTELATIGVGDNITLGTITWTVEGVVDNTTWFEFTVTPLTHWSNTGVQTLTFTVHGSQPIDYVNITDYWLTNQPDNGTIEGYFKDAGSATVIDDDAYGTDLLLQAASISPDWDLVSAIGSGGGGGGGAGAEIFTELLDTPSDYVGHASKVVAVNSGETGLEFIVGGGGGVTEFTGLTDTPANYTSAGDYFVKVNVGETALVFDATQIITDFLNLTDTPPTYVGQGDLFLTVKATEDGIAFVAAPGADIDEFLELIDTPSTYVGQGGKIVKVNIAEDALEFVDEGPGVDIDEFVELTDTPADYTGHASKLVTVNPGEDALEFTTPGPGIDVDEFPELTDTPADYVGHSDKLVKVTTGEDGLEFIAPGPGIDVDEFVELTDTPADYTGHSTKLVRVNVGETGLEFVTGSGAAVSFLDLTDTPSTYVPDGGKAVMVLITEDGLEFASITEDDIVMALEISNFWITSPGLQEKTINYVGTISVAWSLVKGEVGSGEITWSGGSYTLTAGDIAAGTATIPSTTLTDTTTFNIALVDANDVGNTQNDSAAITFVWPFYYGVTAQDPTTLTETDIEALTKYLVGYGNHTVSASPSAQYVVYCYTTSYGNITRVVKDGALPVSFLLDDPASVNGEPYRVCYFGPSSSSGDYRYEF